MAPIPAPFGRPTRILLLVGLAGALANAAASAQTITIDDFSTNQAALTLTFPPAGTTASSSVSGGGVLATERDLAVSLTAGVIAGNTMTAVVSSGFFSYSQDATITGTAAVTWDGSDGAAALDPTGLGGLDLTAAGEQDALLVSVAFDDLPVDIVFEVFSDAGNASSLTLSLPGLIFATSNYVLPYSAFTTSLGAGADFSNVGAVQMRLGSAVTAPDVVLDRLTTTSTVAVGKTVALVNDVNGNATPNPGDTLRYTVTVSNPDDGFDAAATGVVLTDLASANTTLVVGSVTTSQGSITVGNTAGDTAVAVTIGGLADGASATVTFDVLVALPLPAGVTEVSNQATIDTPTLTAVPSDDPGLPGTADPTVLAIGAAPSVTATKTDVLLTDLNGNGTVNPGDTVGYTVVITNNGDQDAAAVLFTDTPDANTALVTGSVTTSQGTVTTGNAGGDVTVAVDVGTLAGGGGAATITFAVLLDDPLGAGIVTIANQGAFTGSNIAGGVTDDPATIAGDPTVTAVAEDLPVAVPTLEASSMIALAILLAAIALVQTRRRRVGRGTRG